MSYGIEIKSGLNTLQIASDRGISGFKVSDSGSGTTIPGTTAGNFSDPRLILVKVTPSAGTKKEIYINKNVGNWAIVDEFGDPLIADYVIIETFKDVAEPTGSAYGIQIRNSNNQVAFDTRITGSDGVTLTSAADYSSFSGDWKIDPVITTNLSNYVSIDTSLFTEGNLECGFVFANNYVSGSTTYNGIYYTGKLIIQINVGGPVPSETIYSSIGNLSQIFTAVIGSV